MPDPTAEGFFASLLVPDIYRYFTEGPEKRPEVDISKMPPGKVPSVEPPPVSMNAAAAFTGATQLAMPIPGAAAGKIAKPFFSRLLKTVEESTTKAAHPDQWAGMLRNAPGVKAEELKWTEVLDWLHEHKNAAARAGSNMPSTITKDELLEYLREHQINVQEVIHGPTGMPTDDYQRLMHLADRLNNHRFRVQRGEASGAELGLTLPEWNEYQRLTHQAEQLGYPGNTTRHERWTLPGGKNYRELLLTMPPKPVPVPPFEPPPTLTELPAAYKIESKQAPWGKQWGVVHIGDPQKGFMYGHTYPSYEAAKQAHLDMLNRTRSEIAREHWQQEVDRLEEGRHYTAGHWAGTPDVLAHVRFKERTINGKRTLFIEEIQSDWHQEGRRGERLGGQGYQTGAAQKALDDFVRPFKERAKAQIFEGYETKSPQEKAIIENIARKTDGLKFGDAMLRNIINKQDPTREAEQVYNRLYNAVREEQKLPPQTPFKKSWSELMMKRMVKYAADEGYDAIAWTSGEVHNARYNLRQVVETLELKPATDREREIEPAMRYVLTGFDRGHNDVVAHSIRDMKDLRRYIPKELVDRFEAQIGDIDEKYFVYNRRSGNRGTGFDTEQEARDWITKHAPESVKPNLMVLKRTAKPHIEISGQDLEIGGHEMVNYYDKELRNVADKIGKKYGAKTTDALLHLPDQRSRRIKSPQPIHFMDLTPSLRDTALKHGFPLVIGGLVVFDPDTQEALKRYGMKALPLLPAEVSSFISGRLRKVEHNPF